MIRGEEVNKGIEVREVRMEMGTGKWELKLDG